MEGAFVRVLGRDATSHEISLRYVPSRGDGGDWYAPIQALIDLEGETLSLAWGSRQLDGSYLLTSVEATSAQALYAPDGRDSAGGWAALEMDVRLRLTGGAMPEVTVEGHDDD